MVLTSELCLQINCTRLAGTIHDQFRDLLLRCTFYVEVAPTCHAPIQVADETVCVLNPKPYQPCYEKP